MRVQAAQQKMTISFQRLVDRISVKIDKMRTHQILFNLIQNALKFSFPNSEVVVSVDLSPIIDSDNKLLLKIKVKD